MEVSDIKIRRTYDHGRLKAVVSITVGGDLAVHDIKIIEGDDRMFVAMPSRRENGRFCDIVHPITTVARHELERKILDAYLNYRLELEQGRHSAQEFSSQLPHFPEEY